MHYVLLSTVLPFSTLLSPEAYWLHHILDEENYHLPSTWLFMQISSSFFPAVAILKEEENSDCWSVRFLLPCSILLFLSFRSKRRLLMSPNLTIESLSIPWLKQIRLKVCSPSLLPFFSMRTWWEVYCNEVKNKISLSVFGGMRQVK